jgi:hypothetical protein
MSQDNNPFAGSGNGFSGSANVQEQGPLDTGINSPDLSVKTLKPKRRAVTDLNHLGRIVANLQQARRYQNEKNGRIQAKLNSERPYEDASLRAEGLGYKSNFSTKPMSTTIGKVASRLTKSIQSARYLTSAELPDSIPDAKKKTELFRKGITDLIRKWPGWFTFVNDVASENSTFGWTTAAWFDKSTWHPVHFRQDRAFLPDGTKQGENSVQFGAFLEYVFPHELVTFIEDREAAELAGWDIMNTVDSINNARPPTLPTPQAAPYTDFRRYEDAIRESSATLSMLNGAKQVMLWHIPVTEVTGEISYYIMDGNSLKCLYKGEDRFKGIKDCLSLISFEQGNGTLMGSKGIGREIYELTNIIDRARNETVDRLQMSGKIIVSADESQIDRFKLSVIGNVALIPTGFQIQQNKIESGIKEFIELDTMLVGLLDQIAGSVSPQKFEGDRVTKAAVDLFAERDEEKRDDVTTRFVQLFANNIVGTIQRRVCSDEVQDEDAKEFRRKMLDYMPKEELEMLAEQPALQTIEDYTQSDAQRMMLFAQEKRNDPLYNQSRLQFRSTAAAFSAEFADDVLLPQNDPTETAENSREQLFECTILSKPLPVPISPRDNHQIHIAVLQQILVPIAAEAAKLNPDALKISLAFVKHWEDHMDALLAGGTDAKTLAPMVKELKTVQEQMGKIIAQVQHAAQQHALGASPVQAHASAMGVTPDNEPGEPAPPPPPAPGTLGAAPPPAAQ